MNYEEDLRNFLQEVRRLSMEYKLPITQSGQQNLEFLLLLKNRSATFSRRARTIKQLRSLWDGGALSGGKLEEMINKSRICTALKIDIKTVLGKDYEEDLREDKYLRMLVHGETINL